MSGSTVGFRAAPSTLLPPPGIIGAGNSGSVAKVAEENAASKDWQPKAWQTGLGLAAIAAGASFQRSMMPRTKLDQTIITAASIGMGFAAGAIAEKGIEKLDDHVKGGRNVARSMALLGGIGAWAGLAALGAHSNMLVSTIRTAGLVVASAAAIDILLNAEHHAADDVGEAVGGNTLTGHAILFGGAALAVTALTIGHIKRADTVVTATEFTRFSSKGDAQLAERMKLLAKEPVADLPALALPQGSTLDVAKFTKQGERFMRERTSAATIQKVMGEAATEPVRVYMPLNYNKDHAVAAQQMIDEMKLAGAFEKSRIAVYTPSGTGFVNPFPVEAEEFMARGDVASVAFQYGKLPSVLSPHKARVGGKLDKEFFALLQKEIAKMPVDKRPQVMVYGESLGAWASQWPGKKTPGVEILHEQGIDRALWAGTPYRSKWYKRTLDQAVKADPTGELRQFRHIEDFEALTQEQQKAVRFFSLRHDNDAVGKFGIDLLVQRPSWLPVAGERPVGIPQYQQYMPGVTFLQTLFDTKNATHVIPGVVEATGHDYRADIAPMVRSAFGHGDASAGAHFVNVDQLRDIGDRLVASELARATRLAKVVAAGATGKVQT